MRRLNYLSIGAVVIIAILYILAPMSLMADYAGMLFGTVKPIVASITYGDGTIPGLFVPPLSPANGGVGTMTGAPTWARYFGDGSEGVGQSSGAVTGEHWYTTWNCTGTITLAASGYYVVRATGPVTFSAGCIVNGQGKNSNNGGWYGGAGGSGGGGAAASSATLGSAIGTAVGTPGATFVVSGAAALSSVAGNNGGTILPTTRRLMLSMGPPIPAIAGGVGSPGGSSGGAAGAGGAAFIVTAPTVTIANGATFNFYGNPGTAAAANSTGGGGGGGGGVIIIVGQTIADNGGIYNFGGGPGGANTSPSIQAVGGGCSATACGTGAIFTLTGLTAGGLDSTKVTVTNAGSGYQVAPICQVNAGASGLVGATCHFAPPIAGVLAAPIIDNPGTGGTLTTYTTSFIGGYGANGIGAQMLIQ